MLFWALSRVLLFFTLPSPVYPCLGQRIDVGQLWRWPKYEGFPETSVGKESAYNAGDPGLIPGLGRSPGEEKGFPLRYCGLENSMDCIVHEVAKRQTWLSNFHFQSIRASALASVLPMNIQSWFPLGLIGLISLLSKGLPRVNSLKGTLMLRKIEGEEEKRVAEDETIGSHHWLNRHEFKQTPRNSKRQEKPAELQFRELQRVRHNLATEQQQNTKDVKGLNSWFNTSFFFSNTFSFSFLKKKWDYNCRVTLYQFQMYTIMISYFYELQNDHIYLCVF